MSTHKLKVGDMILTDISGMGHMKIGIVVRLNDDDSIVVRCTNGWIATIERNQIHSILESEAAA